jgi:hypothetical protein
VKDDAAGLVEVVQLDGTVTMDLEDRFQSVTVGHLVDGRVETRCLTSTAEVNEHFGTAPAAPATPVTSAAPALEEK